METKLTEIVSSKMFGEYNKRYKHFSTTLVCSMTFHVLYWLSGLTCTDENFIIKSRAQRAASAEGVALIAPDTSPSRQLGFWCRKHYFQISVDATQEKWKNWRMYDYVVTEVPELVTENFPQLDTSKPSISGHSMVSICLPSNPFANPINCPWGQKAFTNYLGDYKTAWEEYDATCLISMFPDVSATILIDQGEDDNFLHDQALAHKFEEARRNVNAPLLLQLQPGYDHDHSYFFVSTFIDDHIRHHA